MNVSYMYMTGGNSWLRDLHQFKFVLETLIESQRDRTTNCEIGPVADQNYEIWNCQNFVT